MTLSFSFSQHQAVVHPCWNKFFGGRTSFLTNSWMSVWVSEWVSENTWITWVKEWILWCQSQTSELSPLSELECQWVESASECSEWCFSSDCQWAERVRAVSDGNVSPAKWVHLRDLERVLTYNQHKIGYIEFMVDAIPRQGRTICRFEQGIAA